MNLSSSAKLAVTEAFASRGANLDPYCGTQGLLKEVPLDKVHEFEARFLQELRTSHQRDVLDVLKTGVINDEIRGILEKTAKELWVH